MSPEELNPLKVATAVLPQNQRMASIKKKIEKPMLILCIIWLCILIVELAYGPNPILSGLGTILWIIFASYFLIRWATAPNKLSFLKVNWLYVTAVLVSVLRFFPFLQPFPLVRALTATFGMQVIWIFASADQGMRSMRKSLGHRGVGYALTLTSVVIFAGAGGILHFEGSSTDPDRIQNYPSAVWWTAMQMTNIGSAYALRTPGGRAICLAISVYAAAMFGYLTALFATFFIDRDIKDPKIEISRQKQLQEIHDHVLIISQWIDELRKK